MQNMITSIYVENAWSNILRISRDLFAKADTAAEVPLNILHMLPIKIIQSYRAT